MLAAIQTPKLTILHVLTLSGRNGEYGGPVRVARELCGELNRRGHATQIFSGALKGSEPTSSLGQTESFTLVKPLTKRLATSSLWSWKLPKKLAKLIKESDLVHIHFGRDLISFLAALICIINQKSFVAQTHGMIVVDSRLSTKVIDLIATRWLLGHADMVLALTDFERSKLQANAIAVKVSVLPNGIFIPDSELAESHKVDKVIIFCSRLDKRKKVSTFIEIANRSKDKHLHFAVYGPDGGDLDLLKSEIPKGRISNLKYLGALAPESVSTVLKKADLLILPSINEPFPMVILESLAVGTPVVINSTCGIWKEIFLIDPLFVVQIEDIEAMEKNIILILEKYKTVHMQQRLIELTQKYFSIHAVGDTYTSIIRNL